MVNDPRFLRRVPPAEGQRKVSSDVEPAPMPVVEVMSLKIRASAADVDKLAALLENAVTSRKVAISSEASVEELEQVVVEHPHLLMAIGGKLLRLNELILETVESGRKSRQLVQVVNQKLVDLIGQDPKSLLRLPGRLFEDLFADVLADLGFDLSMRVMTELGEVDILGFTEDVLGQRIGYIFELKQLGRSGRSVELNEVTRLYGLRDGLRQRLGTSQGVFVTTTDFTSPAKEAGKIYDLNLKNYQTLIEWVRSCYTLPIINREKSFSEVAATQGASG